VSTAIAKPVQGTPAESALYSFLAALGAGELNAATACFTREGCMVTPDGTAVHGRAGIAPILAQLIARRTQIEVEQLAIHTANDVALAGGRLAIRSRGPDGNVLIQPCSPTVALQRVEGIWKIAVLAPWANG
jgi:ketosteroid isomerase-like protein